MTDTYDSRHPHEVRDGTPHIIDAKGRCLICLTEVLEAERDSAIAEVARLKNEMDLNRYYKPCAPCLEDRHADCTGLCASWCCALSDSEKHNAALGAEVRELKAERQKIRLLAAQQACDDGLWFEAKYISESYLQEHLRRLHTAIEDDFGALSDRKDGAE